MSAVSATGAPFQLGKGPIVVSGDGPLSIAYNDSSWGDNIGSYAVTLTPMAVDGSGGVGGSVPATLSLTLGTAASFGAFTPGLAHDYIASTTATVISTAGDATLSVADPSSIQTGHLVNGSFFLAQALQARANTGTFAAVGSSAAPTEPADLRRAGLQRPRDAGLQADDRRHRSTAHRQLLEAAHLHALHDDALAMPHDAALIGIRDAEQRLVAGQREGLERHERLADQRGAGEHPGR